MSGARPLPCDNPLCSQAEELRTQLRLLEDARDGTRRELLEAQRKVRESQDGHEAQRQEAGELRRSLSQGAKEREALRRSNEELRAAVKKAESERIRCSDVGGPAPSPTLSPIFCIEFVPWKLTLHTHPPPEVWGKWHRRDVSAVLPQPGTWVLLGDFSYLKEGERWQQAGLGPDADPTCWYHLGD